MIVAISTATLPSASVTRARTVRRPAESNVTFESARASVPVGIALSTS